MKTYKEQLKWIANMQQTVLYMNVVVEDITMDSVSRQADPSGAYDSNTGPSGTAEGGNDGHCQGQNSMDSEAETEKPLERDPETEYEYETDSSESEST